MFIDTRTFSQNDPLKTDICIVGAGAAGITIAKEFINTDMNVLLVESGGVKFHHPTQFLYRAENIGRDYQPMEFTKRRQFGGSTVTWFGRCRPLDELDFETRSWIPYSGWPFDKTHLDPFYIRAKDYCQLVSDDYSVDTEYFKENGAQTKRFYFSPPVNFGEIYKNELANAKNMDVLLHANVINIGLKKDGASVDRILCKTLNGKTFTIKAKVFILAASALENTRLLLASRDIRSNGIGNQNDLVGRFFMEHPHIFNGVVESFPKGFPSQFTKLNYDFEQSNLEVVDAIGLSQERMRRERLLNGSAFLVSRPLHKAGDLYYSHKSLALLRLMDIVGHREPPNQNVLKYMVHVLKHANTNINLLLNAIRGKFKRERRFVLRLQMETVPNPESRVTLSERRDALGEPRVALNWRTTAQDVEAYQRFDDILRKELSKEGMRIRKIDHDLSSDGWPVSMLPAKHAMGTTRMHKDEKQGVVDEHCRVHGVQNLYVAGGSVFPTSGMANPTLTIVALAIRSADHIKQMMDV